MNVRGVPLDGHRRSLLGPSPFADTVPSIGAALVFGIATVVWVVAGRVLPGGRWLAVHLFTLGVLTNLVLGFTEHFARTLTRQPAARVRWQVPLLNLGVLSLLLGLPNGARWAVVGGAVTVTTVVLVSYARIRRMRRGAVGARFSWIVRTYERAHGAFVHGAVLGGLMGVGALSGEWYLGVRAAHLHTNILGWGGLTLLATLVFFGPTMARTRIVAGADERAAVVLRHGATALTLSVLLMIATGVGGTPGAMARVASAASLAVFARGGTITCIAVGRAAIRARPSPARWSVIAVCAWFPAVLWTDVAIVGLGAWHHLDAVGLAMILGVLVQSITGVLVFLAPMLRGRSFSSRDLLLARLERGAGARVGLFNVGTALAVGAASIGGSVATAIGAVGWGVTIAVLGVLLLTIIRPLPRDGASSGHTVRSAIANRYRG